jgi:iron(III) transport system permease protein
VLASPTRTDKALLFFIAALLFGALVPSFFLHGTTPATDVPWDSLFEAFERSLLVAALSTLGAFLIGIPAGWWLSATKRKWFWLALAILPLALPASVAVSGWVGAFAPPGAASRFKVPIPGFDDARGWLFAPWGASLVLASTLWPVVALQLWPAFGTLSRETYDAARMTYSPLKAFTKAVLPQVARDVAAAALLVFLLAASDFNVCSLLLVRTLTTEIHDFLMLAQPQRAAFASLPLLAVIGAGLAGLAELHRPRVNSASHDHVPAPRWTAFAIVFGVAVGFVLPMAACFYQWQHGGKPMSSVFTAGSDALGITLRLALAAAFLAVFVAGLRVALWPQTSTRVVNGTALLLLCVPSSFLGAGLLALQIELHAAFAAAVLSLGFVLRFLYVPLRLVEEGLDAIPPHVIDAARLVSPSRFHLAATVALPLCLAHLLSGGLLVFLFAISDTALPSKLAPPGAVPATVWLFQQQHLGYDEAVFGLSALLGAVAVASVLIVTLALAFFTRRASAEALR